MSYLLNFLWINLEISTIITGAKDNPAMINHKYHCLITMISNTPLTPGNKVNNWRMKQIIKDPTKYLLNGSLKIDILALRTLNAWNNWENAKTINAFV